MSIVPILNLRGPKQTGPPGSGTIPWPAIRGVIERAGYPGFVGMEFSALGSDDEAARRSLDVFSQ
jgi:sugar phosphate isomerase/epimerase